MTGCSIEVEKMGGILQHIDFISSNFHNYSYILPFGIKNYNQRIGTEVERRIIKDIEYLEELSYEKANPKEGNWILGLSESPSNQLFDTNKLNAIYLWQLERFKQIARKYPTSYWYTNKVLYKIPHDINDNIIKSFNLSGNKELYLSEDRPIKDTGGYEFWITIDGEKKRIASYSDAIQLHLLFLSKGNNKMAKLLIDIAKKMTDNPENVFTQTF